MLPVQLALAVLLVVVVLLGLRRKAITIGGSFKGLLAVLSSGVAAGAAVWIACTAIGMTAHAPLQLLTAACLLTAAVVFSAPSPAQPAQSTVWYSLNDDTGEAVWAALGDHPDEYTQQFLTGPTSQVPLSTFIAFPLPMNVTTAQASVAPFLGPGIHLVSARADGPNRVLQLRAEPGPRAEVQPPCTTSSLMCSAGR